MVRVENWGLLKRGEKKKRESEVGKGTPTFQPSSILASPSVVLSLRLSPSLSYSHPHCSGVPFHVQHGIRRWKREQTASRSSFVVRRWTEQPFERHCNPFFPSPINTSPTPRNFTAGSAGAKINPSQWFEKKEIIKTHPLSRGCCLGIFKDFRTNRTNEIPSIGRLRPWTFRDVPIGIFVSEYSTVFFFFR